MPWRVGLGIALVVALAAGCATTPTAVGSIALREGRPAVLRALPLEPRFVALVDQALGLLRAGGLTDAVRTYMVASLDDASDWSRELAETRQALRNAQLTWDPFWGRPYYIIRCRNC